MTVLEQDTLKDVVAENDLVFVQYSASWCGNCRIMKPKFKAESAEKPETPFLYVDAEQFPESRKMATVDNLPTFAAFKNGKLLSQVQTNKADILKSFINEASNN